QGRPARPLAAALRLQVPRRSECQWVRPALLRRRWQARWLRRRRRHPELEIAMPAFAYQAVDPAGKRVRGRAEAATPELLLRSLSDRGVVVLKVIPVEPSTGSGTLALRWGTRQTVLEATRALAALLPAGMPLARALGVAATLTSGPVATALEGVRQRVERGESIATALAAHPDLRSEERRVGNECSARGGPYDCKIEVGTKERE